MPCGFKLWIGFALASLSGAARGATPVIWTNPGVSGDWNVGSNWSTTPYYPNNGVPTSADEYDVFVGGADTVVTIPGGVYIGVNSLTIEPGATVAVAESPAVFRDGVNLNGGSVSLRGSNGFTGVTIGGAITGSGRIVFDGGTFNPPVLAALGSSVLIGPDVTVETGAGAGTIGNGYGRFSNAGTICVTTPGTWIALPDNFGVNTGTLKVSAGTLILGHTFTTQTLGTVVNTGGAVVMAGTLDLAGAGFDVANHGGGWLFRDGAISNGTLIDSTGLKFKGPDTYNGSIVLSDVTLANDAFVQSGEVLGFRNHLTLLGTTLDVQDERMFAGDSFAPSTPHTIDGAGTVILSGAFASIDQYSDFNQPEWSIGHDVTVRVGDDAGISARLHGFDNLGTILCQTAGSTLTFWGPWTNHGTIIVSDGTLSLGGRFARADMDVIQRSGAGRIGISGRLDNRGGTLALDPLGPVTLQGGGTIWGGTISSATPLRVDGRFATGTVDGATLACDVDVVSAGLVLTNGASLLGTTIHLPASLTVHSALSGNGTILLEGKLSPGVYAAGSSDAGSGNLDIASGITIRTTSGLTGASIVSSNGAGPIGLLSNRGQIIADTAGAAISVGFGTIDNAGLIRVSNGAVMTLHASSGVIHNTGTIQIGPDSSLETRWQGDQLVNDGTIDVGGEFLVRYYDNSPLAMLRAQLRSGYHNGLWDGPGINSSVAAASGGRLSVGTDDGTNYVVRLLCTYSGDANLDGRVDVADVGALANFWQTQGIWPHGDFNYDGIVDVTDLGILATNWQAGVDGAATGSQTLADFLTAVGLQGVAIPEPAAAASILLAFGLSRRPR